MAGLGQAFDQIDELELDATMMAELVVEIAFNEIQSSPIYAGGLTLRFARVERYRGDKTAAESDTIESVRRLAGVQ